MPAGEFHQIQAQPEYWGRRMPRHLGRKRERIGKSLCNKSEVARLPIEMGFDGSLMISRWNVADGIGVRDNFPLQSRQTPYNNGCKLEVDVEKERHLLFFCNWDF